MRLVISLILFSILNLQGQSTEEKVFDKEEINSPEYTASIIKTIRPYSRLKDFEKVFEISSKFAEEGNLTCQMLTGALYFRGQGVEKNYEKSFSWYKKCSDGGMKDCYDTLGALYYEGKGIEVSLKDAEYWFKKAGRINCYKCYGDGKVECSYCEGSGRRYSFSGFDIGSCNHCRKGEKTCHVCKGVGLYNPNSK